MSFENIRLNELSHDARSLLDYRFEKIVQQMNYLEKEFTTNSENMRKVEDSICSKEKEWFNANKNEFTDGKINEKLPENTKKEFQLKYKEYTSCVEKKTPAIFKTMKVLNEISSETVNEMEKCMIPCKQNSMRKSNEEITECFKKCWSLYYDKTEKINEKVIKELEIYHNLYK